jgi:glutaminyl-tRNA synthetase
MMSGGGSPGGIIRRLGLARAVDAADLSAAVDAALASMPDKVEAYRAGKTSLLGLFTGQVMKATGGKADPKASGGNARKLRKETGAFPRPRSFCA